MLFVARPGRPLARSWRLVFFRSVAPRFDDVVLCGLQKKIRTPAKRGQSLRDSGQDATMRREMAAAKGQGFSQIRLANTL